MMPGPGDYGYSDMVRRSQNVSELKYTYTLNSINKNPPSQRWGKATDRFRIPKDNL
jgi:hypothetical protein